jgi:hypothetical protein
MKHFEAEDIEVEEEDPFPATVVIFTFMPWPQWPNVPQAK